jgi:hypothetical protein
MDFRGLVMPQPRLLAEARAAMSPIETSMISALGTVRGPSSTVNGTNASGAKISSDAP